MLFHGELDFERAEAQYRHAFTLDRDRPWHGYALLLLALGRYDEAIEAYRRAEANDPLSLVIKSQLARAYSCVGRFDDALAQLERLLRLRTARHDQLELALALKRTGRPDEALATLRRILQPDMISHPNVALLYARIGRPADAESVLRGLEEAGVLAEQGPTVTRAAVHLALGEPGRAVRMLEEITDRDRPQLLYHHCYPEFEALGGDPRYQRILRRLGLPDA